MIKVYKGLASRSPLPGFLVGLSAASLADLSWTDPSLGVRDFAWWPEESQSPPLNQGQTYGPEVLIVDKARKVVVSKATVIDLPPVVPEEISPRQFRQALNFYGFRQQVEDAIAGAGSQNLKDWYEFTSVFQRHHPEVMAMAAAMQFTPAQMDQVWIYGNSLGS